MLSEGASKQQTASPTTTTTTTTVASSTAVDCRRSTVSEVNSPSPPVGDSIVSVIGKGAGKPVSPLGKLFASLPFSMPVVGCLPCTKVVDPSRQASKKIEKQLNQWSKKESKVIQLLLIGAGESGKTTIIKQMKILHIQGFSAEERLEKCQEIKENVFEAIKELTSNMAYLKPPVQLENVAENEASLEFVRKLDMTGMASYSYPDEFFEHVKRLWSDPGIQQCYLRANEFFLIDSAKYFLDKIDEIREPSFSPTDQDILHSRRRTSEIQRIEFEVKVPRQYGGGYQPFWMFDVGGQRGERRKWIQVFDGITAILFVIDSSGFDCKLREDGNKNRLKECLELFEDVWFSKYLVNTGFILFLNKQDILKEKIERGSKIENYFPEYKDYKLPSKDGDPEDEYIKARCFIRDKFLEITKKCRGEHRGSGTSQNSFSDGYRVKRECFFHFTTATDSNNIRRVFDDIHTMILMRNIGNII
ncbi:hypothetical protein TYRP_018957 [Tyrophagus putrescentiae]|nr:hypothetical protein TYRP_018957 [Tyrophagus putrescentiae]